MTEELTTNTQTREFEILNQYGIHARPATLLVKASTRYNAEITIENDGNVVSGASIMGLMTLAAACGTKLKVTAEGEDCEEALDHIQELFERKFDED